MKGFDPVIFDLDGTVVDTVELIVASFRYAVRTVLGEDLPDEVITAGVGQPLMTQMMRLSNEKAQQLYDVYREYNHRRHDELIRSYDGMEGALRRLHDAGRRLGIVTSKSRETTQMAFDAVALGGVFDTVVTATDTDRHKPDPDPILLCLERLGGDDGSRGIYIGDSPVDMTAGLAAGLGTAAVAWGVFPRDVLLDAGAQYWLERPGDLVPLCLEGRGEMVPAADQGRH